MTDDTTVKTDRDIAIEVNKRLDALEKEVERLKRKFTDLKDIHYSIQASIWIVGALLFRSINHDSPICWLLAGIGVVWFILSLLEKER